MGGGAQGTLGKRSSGSFDGSGSRRVGSRHDSSCLEQTRAARRRPGSHMSKRSRGARGGSAGSSSGAQQSRKRSGGAAAGTTSKPAPGARRLGPWQIGGAIAAVVVVVVVLVLVLGSSKKPSAPAVSFTGTG